MKYVPIFSYFEGYLELWGTNSFKMTRNCDISTANVERPKKRSSSYKDCYEEEAYTYSRNYVTYKP